MKAPLLIENGTILTMDGTRRILDRGHVLVEDGRITAIGDGAMQAPDGVTRIDAAGMVVMPGLIDTHAHAGHMLTKGLGGDSEDWMTITGRIYAEATDPEFWAAEAALSAAERIRCGTTTAALLFGGGPDIMRTEAPDAAEAHLAAIAQMRVREVLAVGPNRPSRKSVYRVHDGASFREVTVSPMAIEPAASAPRAERVTPAPEMAPLVAMPCPEVTLTAPDAVAPVTSNRPLAVPSRVMAPPDAVRWSGSAVEVPSRCRMSLPPLCAIPVPAASVTAVARRSPTRAMLALALPIASEPVAVTVRFADTATAPFESSSIGSVR